MVLQDYGSMRTLPIHLGKNSINCHLRFYANMAMVHRLCPSMALTPIDSIGSHETGLLVSEKAAIKLMQTTQWIYERGMKELQEAAVLDFHDIPDQIRDWDWSDKWSYPVLNHKATYLTFGIPTSDKGSVRPVRNAPSLLTYEKCVVMPYHEANSWTRLRKMDVPPNVSYIAQGAQDGEMNIGDGEGQPEYKDSTERMQDLAEEEGGDKESASQRVCGP